MSAEAGTLAAPTEESVPAKEEKQKEKVTAPFTGLIIAGLSIYLVALSLFLTFGLIQIWPAFGMTGEAAQGVIPFLFWTLTPTPDVSLILIVVISGTLGSLVHALRSMFWYVGNREFEPSWSLMYLLLPLIGAILSLIFFFILRGGLFSPQGDSAQAASPFGFAGISALIGMFSNRAALKLQEVMDFIMKTTGTTQGKDSLPATPTEEPSNQG